MKILDELEAAEKAATPGKWSNDDGQIMFKVPDGVICLDGFEYWGWNSYPCQYSSENSDYVECDADADLICLMRSNIKALIEVARAAEKASKIINDHYSKEPPHDENLWFARDEIDIALANLRGEA